MGSCIIEKFGYYTQLTKEEKSLLSHLEENKITYKPGEKIRAKGDGFKDLYIIYDGWTIVSSTLDDNIRSIFDFRINADFVGISELSFNKQLYDFHAITETTVCPFPKSHLDEMFDYSQKLRDVFLLIISREQAICYERITSIARRTAVEKVSHFILEVALRFNMIGGTLKETFDMPLKQADIGDILGLSYVHVSRAMNTLKDNGYIAYTRRTVSILNREKLMTLSAFNPQFLMDTKHISNYSDGTIIT